MPQPFAWTRVVRASTRLSGDAKTVYDEMRLLDNGADGCFLQPAKLAARCGLTPRGLEGIRQTLTRHALAHSERRGRRVHWWVRLPEPCYPSARPTPEEVQQFAAVLDALIGGAASERPTPAGVPRPTPASVG